MGANASTNRKVGYDLLHYIFQNNFYLKFQRSVLKNNMYAWPVCIVFMTKLYITPKLFVYLKCDILRKLVHAITIVNARALCLTKIMRSILCRTVSFPVLSRCARPGLDLSLSEPRPTSAGVGLEGDHLIVLPIHCTFRISVTYFGI